MEHFGFARLPVIMAANVLFAGVASSVEALAPRNGVTTSSLSPSRASSDRRRQPTGYHRRRLRL